MTPRPAPGCPCGRKGPTGKFLPLRDCCGRYIDGCGAVGGIGEISGLGASHDSGADVPAPDAEALMRSRYTAFVIGDERYLLSTWHPSTRPPGVGFVAGAKWLGLQVRTFQVLDARHAEVEFIARYRTQAGAVRMHERSRFLHEEGRWYYVDGDAL
jgi:SEC-C motif-containing protein